jgi:hypothetical protein
MSEYELFSIYGFHAFHPSGWKIELDPKSDGNKGNVAFKSPEKMNILISWGTLDEAKKKYSSPEKFAMDALNRIRESREVKEMELIQTKLEEVNSHEATFTHLRMNKRNPGFQFSRARRNELEIRSVHFFCARSQRYFVIYGMVQPDKSAQQEEIFENMLLSFRCHGKPEFSPGKEKNALEP